MSGGTEIGSTNNSLQNGRIGRQRDVSNKKAYAANERERLCTYSGGIPEFGTLIRVLPKDQGSERRREQTLVERARNHSSKLIENRLASFWVWLALSTQPGDCLQDRCQWWGTIDGGEKNG